MQLTSSINEIIYATFGCMAEKIVEINGGLSGAKLYQLHFKDKVVVLRLSNPELCNQEWREAEIAAMSLASELNVAPKVYYANANSGMVVMDYVTSCAYDIKQPTTVKLFAMQLQKLHQIKLNSTAIPSLTLEGYLDYIHNTVEQIHAQQATVAVIKQLQSQLAEIAPILQKDWNFNLCHIDINPNNLLFDGQQFFLIDWDSARISDPYIDLAAVMNFYIFDPQLVDYFLSHYLGRAPNAMELAKLFFMQQVSHYFYGVRFLKLAVDSKSVSLINVDISDLDRPLDFYARLVSAKENLANPISQARLGLVMLKTVVQNLNEKITQELLQLLCQ